MSFPVPVDQSALGAIEARSVAAKMGSKGKGQPMEHKMDGGLPVWLVQCLVEVLDQRTGALAEQLIGIEIAAPTAPVIQKGKPVVFRDLVFQSGTMEGRGWEKFRATGLTQTAGQSGQQKAGE